MTVATEENPAFEKAIQRYGELYQAPHGFLSLVCEPCDPEYLASGEIVHLLCMMQAHVSTSGGIGLAANQIGSDRRVILVNIDGELIPMINPVIVHASNKKVAIAEGCLSVESGNQKYLVKRSRSVRVKFYMPVMDGNKCTYDLHHAKLSGIEAACVQHEIDHLNGKTIIGTGKLLHAEKPSSVN